MDKEQLNHLLHRYTATKVQIRRDSKRVALDSWETKVEGITKWVSSYDHDRFKFKLFPTGSFYDRLKVKEPDEFDLMLIMEELELGKDLPYDGQEEHDGLQRDPPIGYTTVMIDQGEEHRWKRDSWLNRRGLLNAVNVKAVFGRHVSLAIRELGYERSISQTSQGPAVTLKIKKNESTSYSIDMALAIKDSSWPDDAAEWLTRQRQGWPSTDLVNRISQDGCFLTAKQPKDFTGSDKEFFWHYSFTHAEKRLFREGFHGEPDSCCKSVLRIMKALRENLPLTPLKSYHLKNIMLYECESKPYPHQWFSDQTWNRFRDAMERLQQCLQRKCCPHYFMKELNLFQQMSPQSCKELVHRVTNILADPERYIVP